MRRIFKIIASNGMDSLILLIKLTNHFGITHDYATRIKVIIKSLTLTQEFGREKQIEFLPLKFRSAFEYRRILDIERTAVSHWNSTLYYHHRFGIHFQYQIYYILYQMCIKKIFLRVIVSRDSYHYKIGLFISSASIKRCHKLQLFLSQIIFNIIILYRRFFIVATFSGITSTAITL